MILTVTLNTALDLVYTVPALTPHAAHRVTEVVERPGGKGVSAARVLAALGHEAVVTGFAGGPAGNTLRGLLAPLPVRDALVPVSGATRRTVTVTDAAAGGTTRFSEPGPVVTPAEWAAFASAYEELLDGARAVALCGSLPRGVHVGAYGELVRRARRAGVPVLLDTGGEPLRRGVAARPDLLKPNADELAALTGYRDPLRAARDARRRGAHAVVASLGPDGLLAVTPDGAWAAPAPARVAGDPTGAGDAVVAGLLSALAEGAPWPERLARAAALATATVYAPAAGEFDPDRYGELLERVRVTEEATAA
ncbi:1-phosphofructokinase family hexose kinase [Streptomyces somaliensis]|nr:1-phosphofructokinase family hexose kinase [Streptomyces somaliensis]